MQPALLTETNNPEPFIADDDYCAEEKLNGRRMLLVKTGDVVRAFNKLGVGIVAPLSVINRARSSALDWTIDGELVGDEFYAFDLPTHFDNNDIRFARLTRLSPFPRVRRAWSSEEKAALIAAIRAEGGEGVVFKKKSDSYPIGSRSYGVKFKFYRSETFIVADVSHSPCSIGLSRDGRGWGRVRYNGAETWPKVGELVEVRFDEVSSHGKLMRPILLGVRDDVSVAGLAPLTR